MKIEAALTLNGQPVATKQADLKDRTIDFGPGHIKADGLLVRHQGQPDMAFKFASPTESTGGIFTVVFY